MSPQFVDFDADGHLDIVAGIFDGSPHLVRGSAKGWLAPEQILDRDGVRIAGNQFWNFDTKKWETTTRGDAPGHTGESHLTSAVAFDHDGDGDFDLLLGDHRSGRVFLRTNDGTTKEPAFALRNEVVLAAGQPIDVPGTVATLRLVDWNQDGRLDLACGSMGDVWGENEGGGVVVYLDTAKKGAPVFAAPLVLLERSKKGAAGPVRPDSGLYMDFGDHDGDGDLDMVVGGYSHWLPPQRTLSAAEEKRARELKAEVEGIEREQQAVGQAIEDAAKGLTGEAADAKREEMFTQRKGEITALGKKRQAVAVQLEQLIPNGKRESFVWLYENTTERAHGTTTGRQR